MYFGSPTWGRKYGLSTLPKVLGIGDVHKRSTTDSQFWSGGAAESLHLTRGTKDVMTSAKSPEAPVMVIPMSTRHQDDEWHEKGKLTYVGGHTTDGA